MKKSLFHSSGRFYKANLHTHTNISDGKLSPEEVKAIYKAGGYEILAFTDHEVLIPHEDLRDDDFLPLTAIESELKEVRMDRYDPVTGETVPVPKFISRGPKYHFIFYASRPDETYYPWATRSFVWGNARNYLQDACVGEHPRDFSLENANAAIRDAKDHGFLVCFCHPFWSENRYGDYQGLHNVDLVETCNTASVSMGWVLDDSERPFDDMLSLGKHVSPVCSDDSHNVRHCCGAATYIKADSLSYDDVFASLRRGDVFSTNAFDGAVFKDILFDPETCVLTVETSPTCLVALSTGVRFAKAVGTRRGEPVTHAEFDLSDYIDGMYRFGVPENAFIRLTLIDEHGSKTYSRGYFLPELMGTQS